MNMQVGLYKVKKSIIKIYFNVAYLIESKVKVENI